MSDEHRPDPDQPDLTQSELTGPEKNALETNKSEIAAGSATFEQAADGPPSPESVENFDKTPEPAGPEAATKPERLQKILAQAGIASRRHAEELITQGRVQVNGKVITELGTKADAIRDHIRVDGKLLQGSERLRYFMLNKPKGFVTTVSDPEGRPTIMQFFSKMRERLYPVGRLDYLSEGLLLVTNDGELAHKLTRAASGVEKTYLVKVSGQPTEEEIDQLREGVGIERGKPGSGRVQTSPAQIRKVRQGDNPWYEVVIIEGRNRELRKMFEEIGHHVEKIRRVGYGPLVLDLEPGNLRELEPDEIENLRKASEGNYRKPKARKTRMHTSAAEAQLPTIKPRWTPKPVESRGDRRPFRRPERGAEPGPRRTPARPPERGAGRVTDRNTGRSPERGQQRSHAPGQFRTQPRGDFRPAGRFQEGRPQRPPRRDGQDRPFGAGPNRSEGFAAGPPRDRGARPSWGNKPERGSRPPRFDRNAASDRGAMRPDRIERGDRRRPTEFRPGPPADRGSQSFVARRPNAAGGSFTSKRKLEIRPADELFGDVERAAPARQDRRPSQTRSDNRSGRSPSAGFAAKDRGRPQLDRSRPQRSASPRSFDRQREERPRFDRPKTEGTAKPRGEYRPQRSDRPNTESRTAAQRRSPGGGGRSFGAKPAGGRPGGSGPRKPGARPGGRPGGKPGRNRPSARPAGRKPGGKPGGKKRG